MSKRPELIVMTGELAGKRFAIPDAGLRLGRSSSNDVSIPDEELSRNHCLFEADAEGGVSVIDLASANGTYVNGEALGATSVSLKVGDVVEVGASQLCVVGAGEPLPAPTLPTKPSATLRKAPAVVAGGSVDLGLGGARGSAQESAPEAAVDPAAANKRRIVNLICAAAATVLVVAIVMLLTNDKMTRRLFVKKPVVEEKQEVAGPTPVSLTYERVEATAERLVRYWAVVEGTRIEMAYEVRSFDMEEDKKVAKTGTLSKSTEDRLVGLFDNTLWRDVRSDSGGSAEAMNELRSWHLMLARDGEVKNVLVENTVPTGLFREFCEAFETGINNDLQVSVSMRSAKECKRSSKKNEDEGDNLVAHAEVLTGNLWQGLTSLKMARHDLDGVSGCYEDLTRLSRKIEAAEQRLSQRYDDLNGRGEQLLNLGRWSDARVVYQEILALIPDEGDARNRKAEEQIQMCERNLSEYKTNGGRK